MAALSPLLQIVIAAVAIATAVTALTGPATAPDVLLGVAGPAVAACGAWTIVARMQRTAPERTTQTMVGLMMAKVLMFGVYTAVLLGLRLVTPAPFVAGFAISFVALHAIQAMHLRRLFVANI
jgi:hypothetical protein